MTNARSKSEVLSKTCKSYIQDLVIEEVFGRKKEFSSRYTQKGIEQERESIDLVQDNCDFGFLYKNEEHFENDYLTGTPDVNTDSVLLDVKSNWDLFTYKDHLFSDELQNKDYIYQMQGYMALTGKRKSYLIYCLPNTPDDMIEDEVRRAHWNHKYIDENDELRLHVEHNHIYDDINSKLRIKSFIVRYDKDIVKKIYERVEQCREYYESLIQRINEQGT
jgi:hypothetical protein